MYDREHLYAAVIGGGPAGAQCALWLKHMAIPAILLEKSDKLGGQQSIVPDPLSNHYLVSSAGMRAQQIASAIEENLGRHGVPFIRKADIRSIEDQGQWFHLEVETLNGLHHFWVRNLVIATGVRFKSGDIPKTDRIFIGSADDKIRQGNFFEGKKVAVLGGGDNAMETYQFLAKQNPAELKVYARTLRAGPALLAGVPREAIEEGGYNVHPDAMCITLQDDPFGRYHYDYIVVMYGFEPVHILPKGLDLEKDERGFLRVDNHCVTSDSRILAIGEASQRMHPCVATSMADGVVAAKALEARFMKERGQAA